MRRISSGVVALAVLAAGASQATGEADLVAPAELGPAGLVKYWQCPIPLPQSERMPRLYLEEEHLYAITDRGAVYAIDADIGLVRWSVPVAEPPYRVFRPCHPTSKEPDEQRYTCLAGTTHLLIVNRRTGRYVGRMRLPFAASCPPMAVGKTLFIGSVNGRYCALRAVARGLVAPEPKQKKDGGKWLGFVLLPGGKRYHKEGGTREEVRKWQEDQLERLGGPQDDRKVALIRWRLDTKGNVRSRPAVADGVAYVPSDGGTVFACELENKSKEWVFETVGGVVAAPLIDRERVYIASLGGNVYAVGRGDGKPRWQCRLQTSLKRTGHLTGKLLYQPGEPTGVYAIDPKTGTLRWVCKQARYFLAEHDDAVFLLEPGRAIHQVYLETGETVRSMPAPSATVCVGNVRDATLYVASEDGRVMCIRPKDVPYLRRAEFDRRAGRPTATAPKK